MELGLANYVAATTTYSSYVGNRGRFNLIGYGDGEVTTDHIRDAIRYRPLSTELQNALELYLQIADKGGWPAVPAGPTIKPGDDDPRVATLARRLLVTGDLDSWHDDDQHYNDELRDAVLRFQARHGLGHSRVSDVARAVELA